MKKFEEIPWRWIIMTGGTEKSPPSWVTAFPTKEGADKFMTDFYIKAGYTCFPVYKEIVDPI